MGYACNRDDFIKGDLFSDTVILFILFIYTVDLFLLYYSEMASHLKLSHIPFQY